MSAGDAYNSNNITSTLSPHFLSLLHRHCQEAGHLGNDASNWTVTATGPTGLTAADISSTEVAGDEEEDTDFGAVMYITAVLVFYSLGIVVMIIKYLQTERREMEEEMALESYLQGIPSKLIEQERQAVNRVAIQAFHTLTSGSKRHNQVLVAGAEVKVVRGSRSAADQDQSHTHGANTTLATSTTPDDSDSSDVEEGGAEGGEGGQSPRQLRRERSKHLPRVSLVFRDSRSSDRRKLHHDPARSVSGRSTADDSLIPGQRSPHSSHSRSSSPQPEENGQAGVCLDLPSDSCNLDTSLTDTPAEARSDSPRQNSGQNGNRVNSRKKSRRGASAGVRFEDETKPCKKKPVNKTRARPKGSRSSRGVWGGGNLKAPSKDSTAGSSQTIDESRHRQKESVNSLTEDVNKPVQTMAADSADIWRSNRRRDSAGKATSRKPQVKKTVSQNPVDVVSGANKTSDISSCIPHSTDTHSTHAAECHHKAATSAAGLENASGGSPTKVIAGNSNGRDHVTVMANPSGNVLPKRLLVSDV
ncbi:uncharacterized protein [Littorina saxatilis]|uniref:uncharacterized protein n=1 Tax=Littorina saxatilis TaxID=31220 RepID=UPI0038B4FFB4